MRARLCGMEGPFATHHLPMLCRRWARCRGAPEPRPRAYAREAAARGVLFGSEPPPFCSGVRLRISSCIQYGIACALLEKMSSGRAVDIFGAPPKMSSGRAVVNFGPLCFLCSQNCIVGMCGVLCWGFFHHMNHLHCLANQVKYE